MPNLAERIRAWLDSDPVDFTAPAAAAIRAVLDLHTPMPMYGECEHRWNDKQDLHEHELLDIEPIEVPEIGETCAAAFEGNACRACCADDDGYQTAHCAEHHQHGIDVPHCPTIQAIAEALGVDQAPADDTCPCLPGAPNYQHGHGGYANSEGGEA